MEHNYNRYGLIITQKRYKDKILSHWSASLKEVIDLEKCLKNTKIGNFKKINVLKNYHSSKIGETLELFFKGHNADDIVLFYFSGHGIRDTQGNLYFLTYNSKPTALRSTAISASFLKELIDTCGSRRQILIFDCYFSLEFTGREYPEHSPAIDLSQWFKGTGRIILSAGTILHTPATPGGVVDSGNTLDFTSYLVQGLKTGKGDKNGDGLISIDELYEYAAANMAINKPGQIPKKWGIPCKEYPVIAKSILGKVIPIDDHHLKNEKKDNLNNKSTKKPVYTIIKQGWKDLIKGTEYSFYFLYVAIDQPATIAEQSLELLIKESQNMQNYITRHMKGSGGKFWLSKKENHEHIILFPYDGKNAIKVLRCGFLMMLYKKVFDFEESCLEQPLSMKIALHIGNTPYYPNPANIPLVSSDINFIFHFGEYISPDNLYCTEDIKKILPSEYTRYFIPAGDFKSKEIYKLQCAFHTNCV